MRVLIIGCGYVGLPLGAELARRGHSVLGLRRSRDSGATGAGIDWLQGDVSDPVSLKSLPSRFDWVINTVAAGGGGVDEYRKVYFEGTQNILEWLKEPPRRFIYTSSTSVYGQNDGSEVNEESVAEPEAGTSAVLRQTEELLREASAPGTLDAVVLRCAGIYGPDRGYWLRQFLRGEAVLDGAGDRWLNMVHRDDVVGAILVALEAHEPGSIYNVVDDEPAQQRAVFEWLAARFRRPMPPPQESPVIQRRRGATNKRVSNCKLKLELGWKLKYPSFRQGYEAEIARLGGQGQL